MCILCVIQKWSRRVATMLPWLVIPLVGLWALSQLLPPAFQFEITSPRLACVFVLLITLFWYEILMPKLSAWRLRRNALLRERKRYEAIELQKLRKTATKRCRNCLTPYKDQNPGGGKFMCSYCGHISKRPVLEIHIAPGLRFPSSGTIKDLVGKGGKLLNGKALTDSRWTCSQDWSENGGWVGGSTTVKSSYWMRGRDGGMLVANDDCLTEHSYLRIVIFGCKLLTSFFLRIRWLLRMIFRVSSSKDNASSGAEHRGAMAKRAENGLNFPESRVEKARRKAEEKRQARLERELSEEEERKQREEVARLVEERRRLRDEKIEAEKSRSKMSALINDRKREAETKRQERRRDKDNGSSKSNSDVEEIGKKAGKESERRKDFDRKTDVQRREPQKCTTEYGKGHSSEVGHGNGTKNTSVNHFSRGNAGNRYLDRMRGTFLSPSRAFSGNGFFGQNVNNPAAATKEVKLNSSADQPHTSFHRREMCPPSLAGKASISYNNKNANLSVPSEPHKAGPKKSWHQLFTRSSSALSSSSTNVIEQPNPKPQAELQNLQLPGTPSTIQSFDNPIHFGMPPPVSVPMYPDVSTRTGLCFSPPIESSVPNFPEESERFEDPCYVPDPISLLGPISESLDDFELDSGTCFASDVGLDRPCSLKKSAGLSEVSKPSPIESPLSRRIAEEKHNSNWFPIAPKGHESNPRSLDDAHKNEKGTWQMWNTSPLGQDGLGLAVAPGSWLLAPERIVLPNEDTLHPLSRQTMTSLFSTDDKFLSRSRSPQNECLGSGHNGVFNPATSSRDSELWLENAIFPPVSGNEGHIPVKSVEENIQDEIHFHSPNGAASNRSFEMPPQSGWSKKEWSIVQGSGEGVVKSSVNRASNGGLFPNPNPDVHSLW